MPDPRFPQPGPDAPYGSAEQVYSGPVAADARTAPSASLLRWFSTPALAGILVGLLWWWLAPGGAFYGQGTDAASWLPRDLVLAGLCLLAGLVTAVVLIPQRSNPAAWLKLCAALLGGVLGAVVAWQIGTLAGAVWGPEVTGSVNESAAFSLRSYSALLLWPLGCALLFFVVSLGSMLRSPDRPGTS
ncbi:hypothetical protein [Arthrobacter russicus]|uniref:Uncharacterized protein n=1 Tax=Arthrobacter russicus TaxID=172040 RepID=A0ABU1JFG4_9MICC|nr:hypothetical protein [Arthrobacter russicus]MDR6271108.1 hypothetical protein [Arthrobacter russicus]